MGYELYQSRHKGYEIDNLLDDVVDLNTDVAGLKEGYNANKVNMPDGSALPTYLATNMATKTDISDMATKTQVASDINTATKDLVDGDTVDSKISDATKDLVDGDTVDSKISTATADFITSTDIPTASATNKGMVKPDGTTITVDADGTIHGASAIDNLTDIGDVSIVSATDKQVLAYNASKSKWENQDASGGGGAYIGTEQPTDHEKYPIWIDTDEDGDFTSIEVVANPTDTASGTLSKLKVNKTTYDVPQRPTNVSELTNDSGYLTRNNGEVYSTTETRIGTWIDGKPLYRKVYLWGYGPAGSTTVSRTFSQIGIPDGSTITNIRSIERWNSNSNLTYWSSNGDSGRAYHVESNKLNLKANSTTSLENNYFTFILEYTKTS